MATAISIILTFHNAESTVERALWSLAEQTFQDCEFIFVNDGSTDRTVEIIQNFSVINPDFSSRLKLLGYSFQRGSAGALTVGLENAEGEYVIRWDADDTMPPQALEILYNATDNRRNDIVCGYIRTYNRRRRERIYRMKQHINSLNDMPIDTVHFSLCNKLIRRSLFDTKSIVPFPHIDGWDDVGLLARIITANPSIAYVDQITYNYYRDNKSSLTRRPHDIRLREHLMCALLLEEWFVKNNVANTYEEFLMNLKFCAKIKYLRGYDKDVKKWKQTFPEINKHILSLRNIPIWARAVTYILYIIPTCISQRIANVSNRLIRWSRRS